MSKASREREKERARPSKRSDKRREAYAGVDTHELVDSVGRIVEELALRDGGGHNAALVELDPEGVEHTMVLLDGKIVRRPEAAEPVEDAPPKVGRDEMVNALLEHAAERQGLSGEELGHFRRFCAESQALPDDARVSAADVAAMKLRAMTPDQQAATVGGIVRAWTEGANVADSSFLGLLATAAAENDMFAACLAEHAAHPITAKVAAPLWRAFGRVITSCCDTGCRTAARATIESGFAHESVECVLGAAHEWADGLSAEAEPGARA